jgi:glycosyltransferase involved in cell wall biosynthesis
MPAVSIVVPLYNKAHSVLRSVNDALSQSLADIEVIVIDDGSTDGGGALLATLQDKRLTVIRQENAGVSAARNRGIHAATSDWIAFLDADDFWDGDHLAKIYPALAPRAVMGGFANARLESRPAAPLLPVGVPAQVIDDYFAFALRYGGYPNMTSAMLVRRSEAIAAGLFTVGVSLGEDIDFWCRLSLRGAFFYTGDLTVSYDDRPHPSSAARAYKKPAAFPFFAGCLQTLRDAGEVPGHLEDSACRYANFLLLEYARQLLDRGRNEDARHVLLTHCRPWFDPIRYGRRLARTYPAGRAAFALSWRKVQRQ